MKYTLITGASQGMGLEMAKECASLGKYFTYFFTKENLKVLAENMGEKFNVQTDFYEIDLTEDKSAEEIFKWVMKKITQLIF